MEVGEVALRLGGLLGVEQGGVDDESMEEFLGLTPEGDEIHLEEEAELDDDDVEQVEEVLELLLNQAGERSSC